ncbi:MAG: methicillin resistance protein [Betaproteobacteria bacterium HGW-Betaproteobacteria-13]|jgi:hypothetical protein|nr:MAG: methicillin resistance protein [Betaproteobacteria bacterium HGW-Betaproteobacteria-13]
MSKLSIRAFTEADSDDWDRFCADSVNATFLHTRRFLSYHGERFRDCSCIVENEGGKWVGVLPAAEAPGQPDCVVSHPGSTYGGLIHAGRLFGSESIQALAAIANHFSHQGFRTFRYKAVPLIYHRCPAQDDLYALFRLGGLRFRCDISSTIDLDARRPVSSRRTRNLRKAARAGLTVREGIQWLEQFWTVLSSTLLRRHGTPPVHTLDQMRELVTRFPTQIRLACAILDGQIVAGTLLFCTDTVAHAQYIAANEVGHGIGALDAVFEHCLSRAANDYRYFDFGISNTDEGLVLNDGLYRFKTEFGGGGTTHDFFELALPPLT